MLIGLYVFAYLLGAVPFGYLVGLSKGIDITKVGSGNIGATNTYRALGRAAGLTVFVLDVGKGAVPPILAAVFMRASYPLQEITNHQVMIGVFAVLGHMFSPFLKFKGGKGVATGLGTILGIAPFVGLAGFGVFVLVLLISRIVSISSILGSLTVVLTAVLTRQPPLLVIVYGCVVTFVIVRHIPNIRRLLKGTEPQFDFKKKMSGETTSTPGPDEVDEESESGE